MISFTVYGLPATAGSKTNYGKGRLAPDNKRQKPWQQQVALTAKAKYKKPLILGPIIYVFEFYFPRPKYHYGTGKNAGIVKDRYINAQKISKPDVLKLGRAIEDALTGIIWRDDAQVVVASNKKFYTEHEPKVILYISEK